MIITVSVEFEKIKLNPLNTSVRQMVASIGLNCFGTDTRNRLGANKFLHPFIHLNSSENLSSPQLFSIFSTQFVPDDRMNPKFFSRFSFFLFWFNCNLQSVNIFLILMLPSSDTFDFSPVTQTDLLSVSHRVYCFDCVSSGAHPLNSTNKAFNVHFRYAMCTTHLIRIIHPCNSAASLTIHTSSLNSSIVLRACTTLMTFLIF